MANTVDIPFASRFWTLILEGRKTWTSRTKRYGEPGDLLRAFPHTEKQVMLRLDKVFRAQLRTVAADHYGEPQEGCASEQDFIALWVELHPRRGWNPGQWVWVHVFHRDHGWDRQVGTISESVKHLHREISEHITPDVEIRKEPIA